MNEPSNSGKANRLMSYDPCDYRGSRVLITGGLGFIGSNIAHRLVALGARVTILDALLPQNYGNMNNLDGIQGDVDVVVDDIRNSDLMKRLVADKDFIFNLAGQVNYILGMNDPKLDFDISCLGHLTVLEACRQCNRGARIVFSSSRMVYGKDPVLPVPESAPLDPMTIYGVHKLAGERYHRLYSSVHDIPSVSLRITNPYGPRQNVRTGKYGIVNWFLAQAMRGETLRIFGEGTQIRDYVYIDDLVEIFLRVAMLPRLEGQTFNAGMGRGTEFRVMVENVLAAAGSGSSEYVVWPDNYRSMETGDFVADIRLLEDAIGYRPSTPLLDGLNLTADFHRRSGVRAPDPATHGTP